MAKKILLALALLAVPATLLAQNPRQRGMGMGMGLSRGMHLGPNHNLPEWVLQQRAGLNLSADQVTRLEQVAKTLHEENDPVIDELVELQQSAQRPVSDEQRDVMRAHMDVIRKNSQAAHDQVRTILNADQNAQVDSLIERLRQGPAGRGAGWGGRGRRGGRMGNGGVGMGLRLQIHRYL